MNIEKIVLTLPGFDKINPAPGLKNEFLRSPAQGGGFSYFLSQLFTVVYLVAGFLMIYWLVWGVFQYLFAGGNKDALAKARARISWAIIGFLILTISFAISQYVQTLLPSNLPQGVTPIR